MILRTLRQLRREGHARDASEAAHPRLWRGLDFLLAPAVEKSVDLHNLVTGELLTRVGTGHSIQNDADYGDVLHLDGNGHYETPVKRKQPYTSSFLIFAKRDGTSGQQYLLNAAAGGTTARTDSAEKFEIGESFAGLSFNLTGRFTANEWFHMGVHTASRASGDSDSWLFAPAGESSNSAHAFADDGFTHIGASSTSIERHVGHIAFIAAWNGNVGDRQMRELVADPYRILERRRIRYFAPPPSSFAAFAQTQKTVSRGVVG